MKLAEKNLMPGYAITVVKRTENDNKRKRIGDEGDANLSSIC